MLLNFILMVRGLIAFYLNVLRSLAESDFKKGSNSAQLVMVLAFFEQLLIIIDRDIFDCFDQLKALYSVLGEFSNF